MSVSYNFTGRTAIVTGGANGIGRGVAARLQAAGATVAVWDLARGDLAGVLHAEVDVTQADQIGRALEELLAATGRIDILINNAGLTGGSCAVEAFDPAQWRRVIDVNLTAVFEVSRRVVPVMRAAGRGRIVNIASLAGKEGTPFLSAYSAAKAGVIAFTKSLAKELADTDIRVNSVAPAAVETDILKQMSRPLVETMIAKSPLGRLGTVEEVAELVLWLCSDACSFSTGAVFDVSGGRATY
ncbi:SDR family NAD(P)-dependent oxidoreductase [Enterovirga sp.]|uniref:SDR family NAD(P)-dependent oxidoreductase n=1 Tax=Enterovirga sp. TaxID=2026350 RepID=UPI00262F6964|nr:SDR family NAD(P)-dependent oxidoreductase [Enterovirga sp.]MDB5592442.1 family NAD(P)-dependent oxidoreductase [Enterovirga sp.]